ncbi:heme lyase CcmF/NrfE family subunit [Enterovirga sp.]|uniref:heme lyase CcmF/NrfE family subunit n=1 Tax=Enterovirga sp. TaxID=2026350 RepID=UPI002BB8457F|nr:heme lyase CcmF/NrfE family subunit [Enterovirga sp.]HMO27747.1 heme lyase CcmF/NrfE family subunit [Enterovirga sp.]
MLIETGHFALALGLGVSLLQMALPLWGNATRDRVLMGIAGPTALMSFALVAFSFATLTIAHVTSDFSVLNVVEHSHTAKPLIYKISGVWGNHEGSMLLWVTILTLFGALVALNRQGVPFALRCTSLAVQGAITAAFQIFILTTSNPFRRIDPHPLQGQDLNPLLQDIGLAIHPPLLYLGYVGFSMTFAFAMAALIDGRLDAVWARAVRPWALLAWSFLTLGIAMGAYWAYYELGWGGFWFWDPVENASLMPWLAGTALIHSIVVMEKREALKVWTVLLAILTFSLSLLGTFLVRSGVLTSVHSFAVDPGRGVAILLILTLFIGGSLAVFAWRAPLLRQGGLFAPISREGALVLNNLILASACATVFIGTLYPLGLEALTGEKISVGAPYYDTTFIPLALPLLFLIPVGQRLAWKRGDLLGAAQRLFLAFALSLAVALALFAFSRGGPVLAPVAVRIGLFVILGSATEIWVRAGGGSRPAAIVLRRAAGLPRSTWGSVIAHAGMGVTLIGLAAQAWSGETIAAVRVGDTLTVGRYEARLLDLRERVGPNYVAKVARIEVRRGGAVLGTVDSEKRSFRTREMTTTEAGLLTDWTSQFYASFGEIYEDGSIGLRLYDKPLILLIFIGALLAAAGGALCLSDRRLRIGAPARMRRSGLVPAE